MKALNDKQKLRNKNKRNEGIQSEYQIKIPRRKQNKENYHLTFSGSGVGVRKRNCPTAKF